jgi:hypothetical protein
MLNKDDKKARENTRKYFLSIVDFEYLSADCGITIPQDDFTIAAAVINAKFKRDKLDGNNLYRAGNGSRAYWFNEWIAGLPGCVESYVFCDDAITALREILEVSESERVNIDTLEAEKMLSYMIYHEIREAV